MPLSGLESQARADERHAFPSPAPTCIPFAVLSKRRNPPPLRAVGISGRQEREGGRRRRPRPSRKLDSFAAALAVREFGGATPRIALRCLNPEPLCCSARVRGNHARMLRVAVSVCRVYIKLGSHRARPGAAISISISIASQTRNGNAALATSIRFVPLGATPSIT